MTNTFSPCLCSPESDLAVDHQCQNLRFHSTFHFTRKSLTLQLDTVQEWPHLQAAHRSLVIVVLQYYRLNWWRARHFQSSSQKTINLTPYPLHVRISTPPCIHQRMDAAQVRGLQQAAEVINICLLTASFPTHSLRDTLTHCTSMEQHIPRTIDGFQSKCLRQLLYCLQSSRRSKQGVGRAVTVGIGIKTKRNSLPVATPKKQTMATKNTQITGMRTYRHLTILPRRTAAHGSASMACSRTAASPCPACQQAACSVRRCPQGPVDDQSRIGFTAQVEQRRLGRSAFGAEDYLRHSMQCNVDSSEPRRYLLLLPETPNFPLPCCRCTCCQCCAFQCQTRVLGWKSGELCYSGPGQMPEFQDMPAHRRRATPELDAYSDSGCYSVARNATGWPQVCILFLSHAGVSVRSEKSRDICDANLGKRQTKLKIYESCLVCVRFIL